MNIFLHSCVFSILLGDNTGKLTVVYPNEVKIWSQGGQDIIKLDANTEFSIEKGRGNTLNDIEVGVGVTLVVSSILSYIIKFSLSECLCVYLSVSMLVWNRLQTMRTTVMKLLQVTLWV